MLRNDPPMIQCNLRLHKDLHQRVGLAAQQRGVSVNQEMRDRLQATFEQQERRTIESVAADMQRIIKRMRDRYHE